MNLQGCPPDSKSGASASFATSASVYKCTLFSAKNQQKLRSKARRIRPSLREKRRPLRLIRAFRPVFPQRKGGTHAAFPFNCRSSCICSRARTDVHSTPCRRRRPRPHGGRNPYTRGSRRPPARTRMPGRSPKTYPRRRSPKSSRRGSRTKANIKDT